MHTSTCKRCGGRLVMMTVEGGVGNKWMHEGGLTNHDPDSDDELHEAITRLLSTLTRTQLLLRTGGSAGVLTLTVLPKLLEHTQAVVDIIDHNGGSGVYAAATPPEIQNMEARIYLAAGAIPPAPPTGEQT